MAPKQSPLNKWQKFLQKHKGKGYTTSELSKMYHKIDKQTKRPKKTSKQITFTKKVCQGLVSSKIKVNMEELKQGRYASPEQAIAVSISQVKDKFPRCKRFYKR